MRYKLARTLTDNSLVLVQCYNESYHLCSLDKKHFNNTRVSNYNVYESRDLRPSCQHMKCNAVTTAKSGNSKEFLLEVEKQKKRGNSPSPHLSVHRQIKTAGVFHCANVKIPKISDGFFRPEYSGSPRGGPHITVNRNLLTVPFLTNRFIATLLFLIYVRNSEKE